MSLLKAKGGAPNQPQQEEQQQYQAPQQQYQQPQQQYQAPQQQYQQPQKPQQPQQQQQYQAPNTQNAVAARETGAVARPSDVADLNAGILEGLSGIGESNRVGMDGSDFEYKDGTNRRARELNVIITYGRKLYQYWDDNNTLCESTDGKVSVDGIVCATCQFKRSKECKFKFEIRWLEPDEETEEPKELIFTLPTVSAIEFVNYVKALAKEGLGVGQVVTRMRIERRQKDVNKYSAVVFENAGLAQ